MKYKYLFLMLLLIPIVYGKDVCDLKSCYDLKVEVNGKNNNYTLVDCDRIDNQWFVNNTKFKDIWNCNCNGKYTLKIEGEDKATYSFLLQYYINTNLNVDNQRIKHVNSYIINNTIVKNNIINNTNYNNIAVYIVGILILIIISVVVIGFILFKKFVFDDEDLQEEWNQLKKS